MAKPNRSSIKWPAIAIVILLAAFGAAYWWLRGPTFWSDGVSTRVPDADARLREVLWTPPRPFSHDLETLDQQQYEPSLSPDGTELYFVRGKPGAGAHIYMSRRADGHWTKPASLDVINGNFDSLGPRLTADGNFLLFYSNRAGGLGGYDIWAAERIGGAWAKPFNLGPTINTEFNEFNPDPTPDGKRLIFSTNRNAATREQAQAWQGTIRQTATADYDLFIAARNESAAPPSTTRPATQPATRPTTALPLVFTAAAEIPGINSPYTEGASCMSPAGDFLYFASNRPGGFGKFDLYRSRVRGDTFDPPENLGATLNTSENETDPSLALDGFRLCFSSDRSSGDGRYALFSSDSREVFAEHQARAFPKIGWSALSLIASTLILVPLIFLFRGNRSRNLTLLQRCMVLSLLIHAGAAFFFSFVRVTQDVVHYVGRNGDGAGINLNLHGPGDSVAADSIRGQFTGGVQLPQTAAPQFAPLARASMPSVAPATPTIAIPAADRGNQPEKFAPSLASSRIPPIASDQNISTEPKMLSIVVGPAIDVPAVAGSLMQQAASRAPQVGPAALSLAKSSQSRTAGSSPDFATAAPANAPTGGASSFMIGSPAPLAARPIANDFASSSAPLTQDIKRPELSLAPLPGAGHNPLSTTHSNSIQKSPPTFEPVASAGPSTRPGSALGEGNEANASVIYSAPGASRPTTLPTSLAMSRVSAGNATEPGSFPAAGPTTQFSQPATQIAIALPAGSRLAQRSNESAVAENLPGAEIGTSARHPPSPAIGTLAESRAPATTPPPAAALGAADNLEPLLASARTPGTSSAATTPAFNPTLALSAPAGPLGPGAFIAPPSPFPRAPEQRQPRIEKLGGTDESERAVDRGLAWLAAAQEDDGRWTHVFTEAPTRADVAPHDSATTALALLAFFARDHAPHKDGPYRQHVSNGIKYLIGIQDDDGDLRGPPAQRGGGPTHGNMYDHAIATLALSEAAVMSHDRRCTEAALKGASFIVEAQDPNSGGWRYAPGDYGDTSVFGWQIMALHSAEQIGLHIPPETSAAALRYVKSCAQGRRGALAGYQPNHGPTAAMTAELLYARMLLGQQPDAADIQEAATFLWRQPFDPRTPDLYCWYYGSLSFIQFQNEDWKRWNARTRDTLIALQRKDGPLAGTWDTSARWGDQGGRVFTTSLAVLTLEVYYRYLPVIGQAAAPSDSK